ncbi:MAG: TetR/AcrR family transcriptional regulator [Burkholderiaceae bacterium]
MTISTKDKRIESILDAAERVFSRYGYPQTNMELLAREAELSRQGLYLFFRSKSAVFSAVVERIQRESLDEAIQAADQARRRGNGAVEILIAQINARAGAYLTRLKESPYVLELNEESNRQCPEIVNEYSRKFVASVADTITIENKAGRLNFPKGVNAKKAAQLIVASARGLKLASPPPTPSEFKRDLGLMVSLVLNES